MRPLDQIIFATDSVVAAKLQCSLKDPRAQDRPDKPFTRELAPVDARLYLAQRRFFTKLGRGDVDPFEAEEKIVALVATVLRNAYGSTRRKAARLDKDAHRDLVQRARAEIAKSVTEHVTLDLLASRLGVSVFHLCRIFRERTGTTMHKYRLELRLRLALERLSESHADLSRVALDLGFSRHSHFSSMLRGYYGKTPTAVRQMVKLA